MAFRGPVLVALTLSVVGCSLLTSIPDVTSGNREAPANASADASTGSVDAQTSQVDGAAAGFCAALTPPSTFCDDFDDGLDLSTRWETEGAVQVQGATFRSSPRALFAGPPEQGTCKYSILRRSWGPSYRASRLGFSMRLGVPLPEAAGSVEGQSLKVGDTRCQVGLSVEPGAQAIYEQIVLPSGDILHSAHDLPTITAGEWHDVTIDYDPDSKIVVTIDGKIALSDPVARTCPQGRGAWLTTLGWHCADNAPPYLSMHLDNVTFDPR